MSKVSDVIVKNLLKKMEEDGLAPWQQPYRYHNAMNYESCHVYTGINRWLLPEGEYLTKNQLEKINEKLPAEDKYLFQRGIKWFNVVFYKRVIGKPEKLPADAPSGLEEGKMFARDGVLYRSDGNGMCHKESNLMRFYQVFDIKHVKSKSGNVLPSRLGSKVDIKCFKPKEICDSYVEREGIRVEETVGVPSYNSYTDTISMNHHVNNEAEYWSTLFHEMVHSATVCRRGGKAHRGSCVERAYSFNEMVAELGSALLCAESGITDIIKPGAEFENQAAYLKYWYDILDHDANLFFKAASVADIAFKFIMGDLLEGEEDVKEGIHE